MDGACFPNFLPPTCNKYPPNTDRTPESKTKRLESYPGVPMAESAKPISVDHPSNPLEGRRRPFPSLPPKGAATSFFEFWPTWLMYPPVALLWLLLAIRHRSLTLPLLVNPRLPLAGMVGVSKHQLMIQARGRCLDLSVNRGFNASLAGLMRMDLREAPVGIGGFAAFQDFWRQRHVA